VPVREDFEAVESLAVQEWWPDSHGHDVDAGRWPARAAACGASDRVSPFWLTWHRPAVADFQEDLKEAGTLPSGCAGAVLQFGQLPMLANDLIDRQGGNYSAGGTAAVRPAKSSASTIPIVSAHGFDFVRYEAIVDALRDSKTFRRLRRAER
jgi:hypothetical protein